MHKEFDWLTFLRHVYFLKGIHLIGSFFLITKHSISDEIFIWQYFVLYLQFISFVLYSATNKIWLTVFTTCFLFKMKHVFIISFFKYIVKTFDLKIGIFVWKYFIIFLVLLVLTCVLQQNKKRLTASQCFQLWHKLFHWMLFLLHRKTFDLKR